MTFQNVDPRTVLLGLLPFAALIFFNIKIYRRFLVTRWKFYKTFFFVGDDDV
jgi:hypothetical protein